MAELHEPLKVSMNKPLSVDFRVWELGYNIDDFSTLASNIEKVSRNLEISEVYI